MQVNTLGCHSLPLLKRFCSPYSRFHSTNNTMEIVTQSVLIRGTFSLTRRLLNIKRSLEVLTTNATDVPKLPNDTGIYKSEHIC